MTSRLKTIIRKIKFFFFKLLVERSQAKAVIEADIHRWVLMNDSSRSGGTAHEKLEWLLYADNMEEFRNLIYFRVGSPSNLFDRFMLSVARVFFKPLESLMISSPSVGPGLVIKHGYDTFVDAEKIGENCLIFQDVVVGGKNEIDDRPTIGNYVHISVGSKVLGRITIGDHAVIAANSVVTKDMPPNSLALGIPARIIKDAGNRAEYVASGEVPA